MKPKNIGEAVKLSKYNFLAKTDIHQLQKKGHGLNRSQLESLGMRVYDENSD